MSDILRYRNTVDGKAREGSGDDAAINRVMGEERIRQRFMDMTIEARADSTPESAAQWLHAEVAKWEPLVRAAGITAG
jgi:tripartite-type tricarboxylate transporter receptor subunit TctC